LGKREVEMATDRAAVSNRVWIAFCYLSAAVLGLFAVIDWVPRFAGGAYSVLGIPLYNLVCATTKESNFASALLSTPTSAADYVTFLSDQGCDAQDAERRSHLAPKNPEDDLSVFWGNDFVSHFFSNISHKMALKFAEGVEDTSSAFILLLQKSVLAKSAYFVCYSILVAVLLQALNLGLQKYIHKRFAKQA
jgi:hypothetical protein